MEAPAIQLCPGRVNPRLAVPRRREAEPSAADFYFRNSVGGAGAAPEQLGGRFANTRYRRRNADNG